MVDILAAPQQAKADTSLRTLAAISVAHWVSHFHLFVLPMLFPFLKEQLGVGYIELGFALTVFGVVSGLTQAPIGYLADHIGARKVLLIGLTVGGLALILLGLQLSYTSLIVGAAAGHRDAGHHRADDLLHAARPVERRHQQFRRRRVDERLWRDVLGCQYRADRLSRRQRSRCAGRRLSRRPHQAARQRRRRV